ncbi:MAG: triose-phosphate isomerase [Cytophagaceae bacterium]
MRKKIVAGNWKMNKTHEEGVKLATEIVNMVKDEVRNDAQVVICPPFVSIQGIAKLLDSRVNIGAQNCHNKASGAYTGEVSVEMLKSIGVKYVILGHSERREYFKESNADLAEKVNIVLKNGLTPIFCCGETLAQREKGIHIDFVNSQLTESLFHLGEEDFRKVVIAYEPIWAIGTGVTASTAQAQEMHEKIRKHLTSKYGKAADDTSILYGGSCKPDNAKELFACKDVDGGLIGGASLKSRDFVDIIKSF